MKSLAARCFPFVFALALFRIVPAPQVVVAEPMRVNTQEPVAVAEPTRPKTQAPVPVAEPATQNSNKIEMQIKVLENQWNDAALNHDVATMSRILAEDLIDTDARGHVQSKADDLADLRSGEPKLESSSVDGMKVRVYGNVAVVNGHYTQKGTYKGKDISSEGRFTDVFVKRQDRWVCISTQGTPIAKQ